MTNHRLTAFHFTRSLSLALSLLLLCTGTIGTIAPAFSQQEEPPALKGSVLRTDEYNNPTVNEEDLKEVEAGADLQMTVKTPLTTSASVEGDEFFAEITKNYEVDGMVVIPKGTLVHGVVSETKGPRWAGRNSYITSNFDYLITPDGREIPIEGGYSNKDGKIKAAAKVVGRSAGFTAIGGVAGALMVLKYGGIAAVAASEGYALAGGAAVGGTAGLIASLVTKGKHKMIQPGAELSIKLSEPIVLPSMNIPDETAGDYAPEGLNVDILGMAVGKDPFGEATEMTLTLDMINQTEHTFTFFDIALRDENGTVFFPSAFGDTSMWFKKFQPNSKIVGNLTFSVDNPNLQHQLIFYKRYTREPLAQYTIVDAMEVDKKTSKKLMKEALAKNYSHKDEE